MSETVLETRGLSKRFGAVVAASDINVSVGPAARLSLIGANGAGKTTFVNMVTGYLTPDAGEVLLDEPTSGVSSQEKYPLMDRVMAALEGEKAAAIFVEHDMDIVTRYSDRVLAFYSGEIIADDPPDEVLSDPAVRKYVTGTAR